MRFPWLLGLCLACGDAPPRSASAEPFVVPEISRGRTEERFEHGIGSWFGAVESPLVVTHDAIQLRGTTLVALMDGELPPSDLTNDGVIRALATIDVPHTETAGPSVAIHPAIPYRTVYAILETLRRAPHDHLDLHARREGRPVSVGVWLPTGRPGPREVEEELLLTTTLAPEGLFVAGAGGALAPGCERVTTEPEATIPRRSGRLDLEAYARCLGRVKQTFPDEVVLRVSATPETSFGELVAVLAASKSTERDELFPDVVPLAPRTSPEKEADCRLRKPPYRTARSSRSERRLVGGGPSGLHAPWGRVWRQTLGEADGTPTRDSADESSAHEARMHETETHDPRRVR